MRKERKEALKMEEEVTIKETLEARRGKGISQETLATPPPTPHLQPSPPHSLQQAPNALVCRAGVLPSGSSHATDVTTSRA